jgi:hypothetical protein
LKKSFHFKKLKTCVWVKNRRSSRKTTFCESKPFVIPEDFFWRQNEKKIAEAAGAKENFSTGQRC